MIQDQQSNSTYYHEIVSHSERYPIMVYFHEKDGIRPSTKHWHRSLELCCYINTYITLWTNGVKREYAPDELIIINSGDAHEVIPHNAENHSPQGVSLLFPYKFLTDYSINIEDVRFLETAGEFWDGELRKRLHKIVQLSLCDYNDPYYYLLVNSEIFNILHILITHYCVKDATASASIRHLNRCKHILAYIDNHYNKDITLTSLANELGLSSSYLARYFNKYLGATFKRHLTSVRLQKALNDVVNSDKTMLNIALEYGFPDYRSFINAFRRWYQDTPYQYRVNNSKKESDGSFPHSRPELVFSEHITYTVSSDS